MQYVGFSAVAVSSSVGVYVSAAVVADNLVVVVALTLHGRGCSMYDATSLLLKRGQHLPIWVAMKKRR